MWVLLVVTLVNGGASDSKFTEHKYLTEQQCATAQRKVENETTFGYCSYTPEYQVSIKK